MRRLALLLAFTACAHAAPPVAAVAAAAAPAPPPLEPGQRSPESPSPEVTAPPVPPSEPERPPLPHHRERRVPPRVVAAMPAGPEPSESLGQPRFRLVEAARRYLGKRFAGDCSAFIGRVLSDAEVALPVLVLARSRSESLYRSLWHPSTLRPGDLAFFHATYDRDGPGAFRNRFTHVALVERVEGDRLTLIHRGLRGIERMVMNPLRPHDPSENSRLRLRRKGDRPGLRYLSGELFAGFASAFDDAQELVSLARLDATQTSPPCRGAAGRR